MTRNVFTNDYLHKSIFYLKQHLMHGVNWLRERWEHHLCRVITYGTQVPVTVRRLQTAIDHVYLYLYCNRNLWSQLTVNLELLHASMS